MDDRSGTPDRDDRWLPWIGAGAVLGALLWTTMPWLRTATMGTRPYVGTAFAVVALVGWLLMAGGLVGFRRAFGDRYGRLRRASVGATAAGMAVVTALLLRAALAFVLGFGLVLVGVAGLVLSLAFVLGFGLVLVGVAGLGLALWRVEHRPTATAVLLVLAAVLPLVAVGLKLGSVLPLPVGRLLVGTSAPFVPLGVAWAALGYRVRSAADDRER
jgi:hypothetical protein